MSTALPTPPDSPAEAYRPNDRRQKDPVSQKPLRRRSDAPSWLDLRASRPDRRLSDLLDALRDQDLLILTSDHGCDPTTPSTDHSREHALLLAYVQGRNAAGRIHEDGEFADVGATVNSWLGGKPGRGIPGTPIVEL